jgi:hypothetical protein
MGLHARVVTAVVRDSRGRLVALCNPDEPWSPVPAELAIRQILAGVRQYRTIAQGSTSEIRVVNRRKGPYLRTIADPNGEKVDNLKKLPRVGPAQRFTGNFDGVIQVDGPTIANVVSALYAAQVFPHRVNLVTGQQLGVLCIGAPEITFTLSDSGASVKENAPATVIVKTSFTLWSRTISDATDAGKTASGVVRVPVRCQAVVESDDTLTLAADWSAVTSSDVRIDTVGLDEVETERASQMILDWARHAGGRYALPELGPVGHPVDLSLRFVQGEANTIVAQVGIHTDPSPSYKFPAPTSDAVRVALSSAMVVRLVLAELRTQWGDLPEPYGQAVIDLGSGTKLTALDVEISEGALSVIGRLVAGLTNAIFTLVIAVEGISPGTWNAGSPSGMQGAAWRTDGGTVDVQIDDLLSQIGDFLSGGAIRQAITEGVRSAIASGPNGGLAGVLSRATLVNFARAGTAEPVDIDAQVIEAQLTPFGPLMRGSVHLGAPTGVFASLSAIPLAGSWFLLNAMDSWSPGDRVTRVVIDFGDGNSIDLEGGALSLSIPHEYAPGHWTAHVTVFDSSGRSASASTEIDLAAVATPT